MIELVIAAMLALSSVSTTTDADSGSAPEDTRTVETPVTVPAAPGGTGTWDDEN